MGFTLGELKSALTSRKGASFVTLLAETVPAMRKTNNPFLDRVTKRSRVNGAIGWIYPNGVNRQRIREGGEPDFEAFPRKWGERIKGTPFVEHKGKTYLELKVENVLGTEWFLDGEPISPEDREAVNAFIPTKVEGARQQVENPVILRDYNLANIREITFDGMTIKVG
jgi:hypothetical protein